MEPHKIVSEVLSTVASFAKPGMTLKQLDAIAEEAIWARGAKSYNKGYKPAWAEIPYPAALCLSVNNVIAHGIPNGYRLQSGDILNIDCGIIINGQCGDAALSVGIGAIDNKNERLLRYAKRALYEGIKVVKPGISIYEIGRAIELFAARMGYVVNQQFTGHGIGAQMHQPPAIFSFDVQPYMNPVEKEKHEYILKAGDTICIEPMLTYRDKMGRKLDNGWTVVTQDGKNSAMFEHMVKVTETGHEVLTTHIYQDEVNNPTHSDSVAKRAD